MKQSTLIRRTATDHERVVYLPPRATRIVVQNRSEGPAYVSFTPGQFDDPDNIGGIQVNNGNPYDTGDVSPSTTRMYFYADPSDCILEWEVDYATQAGGTPLSESFSDGFGP